MMKKWISMIMTLVMMLVPSGTANIAEDELFESTQDVVLLNQHTLQTNTRFSISEDGMAHIYVDYMGYRDITTGAVISIVIERGNEDSGWETVYEKCYDANGEYGYQSFEYALNRDGVYRCKVEYAVSGILGEADVITFEDTKEYIRIPETEVNTEKDLPDFSETKNDITYESLVSLSAGAYTKHLDLGLSLAFIHGEQGYIENDFLFGERYISGDYCGIYTYQKGETAAYLNCQDVDCDHEVCSARTMSAPIYVNGRLYQVERGNIVSCALDGSDHRIEWRIDGNSVVVGNDPMGMPIHAGGWRNVLAYGPYIFITTNDEKGRGHIWQYDTSTRTMMDLTAQTGVFIHYEFIYDGFLYGYNEEKTDFVQCDLFLENVKEASAVVKNVFEKDFRVHLTQGTCFVGVLYEPDINGKSVSLGIMRFDIATGETSFLPNDIVGCEAQNVICADTNYFYFLDRVHDGVIYRVKQDGRDCCVIFEDETMKIAPSQMLILDSKVLLYAQQVGTIGGKIKCYADGWYIADLDENGNVEGLGWLNAVQ